MKSLPFFVSAILLAAIATAFSYPVESRKIDALVEANYAKFDITPNPPSSDEIFLRRAYLDIIGRIPTKAEADAWLSVDAPGKRSKLVDYLMTTEGFTSHFYNYWADILRLKTRTQGGTGAAYIQWVKDAITSNKPYDQFVREMVTADGMVWDNGAVGYYLRDAGMPLDNMSNTSQIFLGTQLVCAQCHDHPFDRWSQMDYYQMAAFTYGVETRINPQQMLDLDDAMKRQEGRRTTSRNMRRALNDILEPLSYGTRETERNLKLPHDYQYDNAAPEDVVKPGVLFGSDVRVGRSDSSRDEYAEWLASPDNPRFTTVIVNRLWKKVMGVGLIEPIDDFKDSTVASNPELMKYLEEQIKRLQYDQRAFIRLLYNTKTYQRQATGGDVPTDEPYHFPGPILKRMSAEQLWDSVVTLSIPEPDKRTVNNGGRYNIEKMKALADSLRERSPASIVKQAKEIADVMDDYDEKSSKIREKLLAAQEADDTERVTGLRKDLNDLNRDRNKLIASINNSAGTGNMMESEMSMFEIRAKEREEAEEKRRLAEAKKSGKKIQKPTDTWKGFGRHLVRASHLPSPAPNGHFLREFGQSDRETIENASTDASVAQALMLLNSNISKDVLNKKSPLMQAVSNAKTQGEKQDAIFYSIYSRPPTDNERELFDLQLDLKGDEGYEAVIYALLNTSEFSFVQ
ncbi:MAG: DUF1549 domain-containing protein [Verrucomicrobiota bacterium]